MRTLTKYAPNITRALDMVVVKKLVSTTYAVALHHASCDHKLRDKSVVKAIIQTGCTLWCFTVNQVERVKNLLHWGVHTIFFEMLIFFHKVNNNNDCYS